MSVWASLRLAFAALGRDRVRSALTSLGILIGIAAVVIVVSLGQGATEQVGGRIASLGSNVVYVFNRSVPKSGARVQAAGFSGITEDDAAAIRREAGAVSDVTVYSSTSRQVTTPYANERTAIVGVDGSYFAVRGYRIERGRRWTDAEERTKAKVCLIGRTAAEKLFGPGDPMGRFVRIDRHPYRVVGTLEVKGTSPFGDDQDDRIMMPMGSWRARVSRSVGRRVHIVMASARSPDHAEQAKRQMDSILRQRHHIEEGGEADFRIHTQEQFKATQDRILGVLSLLLVSVAAVALFVGGVGVMNIMLVTVAERRREIGIRMAIGAQPRDVQWQFLAEAVTLTLVGGAVGVLLAGAVIYGLSEALGWPLSLNGDALVAAGLTSLCVGVVFGFLPARRAAHLEPMEALRHE